MSSAKKFMIVNGWSDMNRGDSAIVLGMIWLLRKHFPDSSICVMSEFDENDLHFKSGYWAIKLSYPEIQVLPALFPYPTGKSKIYKVVSAALTFAISCVVIGLPVIGRYLFRGAKMDTWKRLIESDVLLSKGGHIFYFSQCSLQALYGFLKHAFPLLLGARLGKKTVLYAQSVGPFHGRICRVIAKWFFNRLDVISVRENISLNALRSLGVIRPVYLVPDAAFLLTGSNLDKKSIFSERVVIVTPRQWGFENRKTFENYMGTLALIVEWLSAKGYKVLLVSHTLGPTPSEDDRVAVKYLYNIIKSKDNVKIVNTEGLTAYDMINLYASACLLIGTRFHSVILALLSGTPVVAISYFGPKTFGIMESIGLKKFVCDIDSLDVTKLRSAIQYILDHEDQLRQEIVIKIKEIINEAERGGIALLDFVLREK